MQVEEEEREKLYNNTHKEKNCNNGTGTHHCRK
jgi:hypothetical protein